MPIYEFRCKSCDTVSEKLCSSTTKAEDIPCPACGKHELARKFSTFGFKAGAMKRSDVDFSPPPSSGGGGCGSCATHNCGSCH